MTATALLAELRDAGISLSVRGDKLRVESQPGAVSAELRARLAEAKPQLIALLRPDEAATRTHLLTLAEREGHALALVYRLPGADLAACVGLPDDTLRAYLRALDRGTVMDRGIVPDGYTQAAQCDGCGPVWLWQGAPARVLACPWCFRRKAGKGLPRRLETCGDCIHYLRDPLNPVAGGGGCALGPGRALQPMTLHSCADHVPANRPEQWRGRMEDCNRQGF